MSERGFDDHAGVPKGPLDAATWDGRWVEGNTPWDMGEPSPPMVAAAESVLFRIVNGPLSLEDVHFLRDTTERPGLPSALSQVGDRQEPRSL